VTSTEFSRRVRDRAEAAGFSVPQEQVDRLELYVGLLVRWNRRINLTALALTPLSDEAIDRLLLEQLAAAPHLIDLPSPVWFDLGSGGGSPAVPIAVVRRDLRLTMVEVREKKAAFLREASRTLDLDASVESKRFEDLPEAFHGTAGLVTTRAVKASESLSETASNLLVGHGLFAQIGRSAGRTSVIGFQEFSAVALPIGSGTSLLTARRVPRGTI